MLKYCLYPALLRPSRGPLATKDTRLLGRCGLSYGCGASGYRGIPSREVVADSDVTPCREAAARARSYVRPGTQSESNGDELR